MAEHIRYIKVDPKKWSDIVGFEPDTMLCVNCGKKFEVNVPIIINNDYWGYEMVAHGSLEDCQDLLTTTVLVNMSPEDLEKIIQLQI